MLSTPAACFSSALDAFAAACLVDFPGAPPIASDYVADIGQIRRAYCLLAPQRKDPIFSWTMLFANDVLLASGNGTSDDNVRV